MKLANNLKVLRNRLKKSQEEVSGELGLTRSSYSGYENEVAQPNLDVLLLLSTYYKVRIDELLKKDFSVFSEQDWKELEHGTLTDVKGTKLRVLTAMVNADNEELIELVPLKASAGYTSGYADPDYLKVLPTFNLPFLSKDKKYRSFPIKGDSMPPVGEGSFVTAEYIQNWQSIRNGTPCIVVTKDDGIVFKVLNNMLDTAQSFQLCSTNPMYEPYLVHVDSILEVWKFVNYISPDLPEIKVDEQGISKSIRALQKDVQEMKSLIKR